MLTMWAALPTHLILSADLRPGAASGGIDADALATLTNLEVLGVNQDPAAQPMRLVSNSSDGGAAQVWRKPLAAPTGAFAVVFFHRGADTSGPLPAPPVWRVLSVTWAELGLPDNAQVAVRDLWAHADLGSFSGSFASNVTQRDAQLFTFRAATS